MKRALYVLLFLLFSKNLSAADLTAETYWEGLKSSVTLLYQGSYMQFTAENNLYYAGAAVPALWYSFEEDKRITHHQMKKRIPKYMQVSSDLAPVLSFPIIPITVFSLGAKYDNPKAVQFAKETFATMYLALAESAALSVIDVHERPKKDKLSKWETNFRGKSSFPSGHVVPYAALTLKTLQFYGPYWAAVPGALFVATSFQRIKDGKHYLSDVVGGFFLTAFAAEGVRKAGKYQDTDTAYKSIFDTYRIGYTAYEGVVGPMISFDW
mgnify:FL=1